MPPAHAKHKGEIYIGVIIAIGIFIILSQAIFTLTTNAFDLITFTRARSTAQSLANEKIETIRNLPYDDIGTIGGIPPGILLQEEEQERNGLTYTIKTSVIFIDDPFDNQAPLDTLPTDYKKVRVDASWGGTASSANTITLITNIAPKGIETTSGGGTLSILVFNAQGEPVPQADVVINAPSLTPPINLTLETSDTGRLVLPGSPVCSNCYEITTSKPGFSTDRTYSTQEVANPQKPHQSVLESQVTDVSFAIDSVARLDLASLNDKNALFTPLANQVITLRGGKIIGTNPLDDPVYKFDLDLVTDSLGTLSIEELEWDSYTVSLPESSSKVVAATNPLSPFPVSPGDNISLAVALSDETPNSFLSIFTDQAGSPIASISATLSDNASFESILLTGNPEDPDFSQAFFKGLDAANYTLTATAAGFLDSTQQIPVAGYTREIIILSPQ